MKYGNLFDPFTGKENIDDTQKRLFLQSPAYCDMIRKMVVGITGNHRLTVHILPINHPELAFTDGKTIMINTLHPAFFKEPIEDITLYCLALATHESLHPLYSCYKYVEDAATKRTGETDNEVMVRRDIFNILEDARIERIGRFRFPGVSYSIDKFNEFLFQTYTAKPVMKEIDWLMQWVLDFVSVDKTHGPLPKELTNVWESIVPLAVKAKASNTCGKCYHYSKRVAKLLAPFIPTNDTVNNPSQKPENTQGNNDDVKSGDEGAGGNSNTSVNNRNNGQKAGLGTQGSGNDGNNNQSIGSTNNPSNGCGNQSGGNGSQNNQNSSQSIEEIKAKAREAAEMVKGALDGSYKNFIKDVNNDIQDKARISELNNEAGKLCTVVASYGDYRYLGAYECIKANVLSVIRNLQKGLKNLLNYNVDEMSRYLHSGKIDAKSLSRIPTGAICAKRIEKSEEADLNITVLVDMSGSMQGYEIECAKAACIVLYEVGRALNIPITILGFQYGSPTRIHCFADSSLKGRFTHTGIAKMFANGNTPLYQALGYLQVHLKKIDQTDKLVIVITDGIPNGDPKECAKQVKKLESDAKVYGLGIGSGNDTLANIFGSRFFYIDTLEKLPKELCKIVERNLFRR